MQGNVFIDTNIWVYGKFEIVYSKNKATKPQKISSLSGLISVGGNSVMDSDSMVANG